MRTLVEMDHRGLVRRLLVAGIAGAIVTIIVALFDLRAALQIYLAALLGWSAIPVGCLAILMIMHLIGGAWRGELDEPLRAGARTLPVAALLFVPVLLGAGEIYPWARDAAALSTGFKAVYLTWWFFALRTVIYFAIWILLTVLLHRSNRPQPAVASVGLILYALTGSLAGVDWAMSLEPEFYSSTYGLIFVTHQMLAGLAAAIAAKMLTAGPAARTVGLGGLLISTVLLWAYLHAMQYIIIWSGDLPEEIRWYIERSAGGWQVVEWILALFQGVIPFVLLLSSRVRTSPRYLGGIALLVLAMRLVEAFWLTLPALDVGSAGLFLSSVLVLATVTGIGGLWGAAFVHSLTRIERPATEAVGSTGHG